MTQDMPRTAGWFGAFLLLFGLATYWASDQASPTALIPSVFGAVLSGLSLACRWTESSKHPMHAAAAVALLGFLGSATGLVDGAKLLAGQSVELPLAAVSKSVMAVATAAFVALCAASFRQARREGQ